MVVASGASLTCKVSPDDPVLSGRVEALGRKCRRPTGPLRLQALLQLPRIADQDGNVSAAAVDDLLEQIARELPPCQEWKVGENVESLRALDFRPFGQNQAARVMEQFHYLRSLRTDASAYGLFTETGRLVAMCTTSTLDVPHLHDLLIEHGRNPNRARVVSRVFAFDGAPKNTISYLLARVIKAERQVGTGDYLTYVNPNLGFSGNSYRASGWEILGDEPGTKYRYLDRRYITDRRLIALFGRLDDSGYAARLGGRFSISRMPLAPLLVFHRASEALLNRCSDNRTLGRRLSRFD